ncbi:ParA family protein [Acidithiobacillus sp. YTS05]|nr:ParA family protein [Acidithiobacillus sp. YTS05]
MKPKFFVFANQKGGVGKTTLAAHMAIHAHQMGYRVLLVDLDQQGSATYLCTGDGEYHQTDENTALDLWYPDRQIPIQQSPVYGFDFLQASSALDVVDDDLEAAILALRRLETLETDQGRYHLVVIDCPPAPGVRQVAPLMVADKHIVPVTPDALGTQGLLSIIQTNLESILPVNPQLEFRVLINRLKANSAKNHATAKELVEKIPEWIIPHLLFDREDVRTALRLGKPYWELCRDDGQKDAWYQAFDFLLANVPDDDDDPNLRETDEPKDAEAALASQELAAASEGG